MDDQAKMKQESKPENESAPSRRKFLTNPAIAGAVRLLVLMISSTSRVVISLTGLSAHAAMSSAAR